MNAGAECVRVCIINIHLVSFNLYLEKITMKQFSTHTKITPLTAANHTQTHAPHLQVSYSKETNSNQCRKTNLNTVKFYGMVVQAPEILF